MGSKASEQEGPEGKFNTIVSVFSTPIAPSDGLGEYAGHASMLPC